MAQYDGSIRINTKISVKEAEVQLTTLENRMKKTADKITSLRSKMDALKDVKTPTQQYAALTAELDKQIEKLKEWNRYKQEQSEKGLLNENQIKSVNSRIAETEKRIKNISKEMQRLDSAGQAFTFGTDTKEYAKLGQQLEYAENEMSVLNQKHDIQEMKLKKAGKEYRNFAGKAKSALSSIGNVLKKTNATVDAFGRKIRETAQKHLPFFRKETEKAKNSTSSFAGRLKSLALSLLIFNQVSKAVRALSSSISAGFKNMYDDDVRFKASIDSLKASVLTLQNAFAAAFRPIADVAVPYIQKFVEWLTAAVNLAGQFFAALTGRKTYTRAIKQTAEASEEAAEAAKKETDEMKKQLSPLDKLNNLTSEKDKGKKDKETGIMFEEVPIDSKIQDMADKVKDILSKLFAPLKEAWNREGKFVMDSWKYALDEVWKLIKDIGRDFLTVWQQEKTIKVFEDLLHILGDIGLVIGHLARNFRDAWNENETGLHILENIRDIIGVIVHNFRLAADETVKWADKLDFGPILEAFERFSESLIPVADALSGILSDFYTQVLLPLGKWTIEKGLPELLDVFTAFNEKVAWDALRTRLSEFWDHLEPFAETVGEGLIIFIERVSDALADFINSESFDDFLTMIEEWMDNVTPDGVADGLEKIAKGIVALKAALALWTGLSGAIKLFSTFMNIIANARLLKAVTKLGGGATAAAGSVGVFGKALASLGGLKGLLTTDLTTIFGAGTFAEIGLTAGTALIGAFAGVFAGGAIGKLLNNYVLAPLFSFDEELSAQYKNFKFFGEDGFFATLKSSFTDGSWKEALSLWGEEIIGGVEAALSDLGSAIFDWTTTFDLFEGAGTFFENAKKAFEEQDWIGVAENIIMGLVGGLLGSISFLTEPITNIFETIYKGICDLFGIHSPSTVMETVGKNIFEGLLNGLIEKWRAITEWVNDKINWLQEKLSGIKFPSFGGGWFSTSGSHPRGGGALRMASPYTATPAIAALADMPIPGYATGQVIPRSMKKHLAILGDNTRETEVVSPISTMKQAFMEAFAEVGFSGGGTGGGNTYEFSVDGQVFFRIMEKYAAEYKKQNGGKIAFS